MSVVYVSSLGAGKECLRRVRDRIAVDYVVTIRSEMAVRASVSGYADFTGAGIDVRYVHQYSMKSSDDRQMIERLAPDLIIVNGWNRLIPPSILALPPMGCVGFHGSWKPLPFGRGRSLITWAILAGATEFFLHLFYLDEGADSGDVIDILRFDIAPQDTCETVHEKVGIASAALLIKNVPKILDGTAPRTPQVGVPTYLPKRTPEQGQIDWKMPVEQVCRLVRAVSRPYSGAFSDLDYGGRRGKMVIWDAVPFSDDVARGETPGTVVREVDGKPLIRCKDGLLLVKEFTF